MTFEEYQSESNKTAKYPDLGNNFIYPVLGLAGETGEVAEKIKKILRDKGGVVSDEDRQEIKKELGDVLFSLVNYARFLNMNPELALKKTTKKFIRRFHHIEQELTGKGKKPEDVTLEELDGLWNEGKRLGK